MAKPNPDTPTPKPAAAAAPVPTAADPEAGEWQVDSASAAIGLAPEDTTVGVPVASEETPPAVAAEADEAPVVDEPPAEDAPVEVPAGEEPAPVAAAPAPADGKPKKKAPIAKREAALTKDIDRLTYQKRTLEADLQKEQARLEQLRLDAAALEKKPVAPPAPAPVAAAPAPEPPGHPHYKDFETDAEYEAAVQKWKTVDLPAWQQQRDEARVAAHRAELDALKAEIQKGVDARLGTVEQEARASAAEAQTLARIEQAKQAHPDWAEQALHLKALVSPWRKDDSHGPTPFLTDVVRSSDEGGEVLYWLASHPDQADILASLQPTRALRDAVVLSPSPRALFEHFATEAGQHEWDQLAREAHPGRVLVAVGALSARLAAASRGSASPAPSPITAAVPSAKPPVGSPRARPAAPAGSGSAMPAFDEWMAQEDAKERAERLRAMGLPVPA